MPYCVLTWSKIIDILFSNYECDDSPWYYDETVSIPEMNLPVFDVSVQVEVVFVLLAALIGILIIELIENRFDYLLAPLVRIVMKRYRFVCERNRMSTMHGHP